MNGDDLARFNDEDWAKVPYDIELRGGEDDGKRFRCPSLPPVWLVPHPPSLAELLSYDKLDACYPTDLGVVNYYRTDVVKDDGAHVYEFRAATSERVQLDNDH